jgi:hypothetical protein
MFRSARCYCFVLPFFASAILAGPKIEFDVKTFDCGVAIEGKTEKLNAVFMVKNTGDSLLKITNVRPGCGCTVVKYDSLIEPGKSAKIESQVNIKNYHGGQISKFITVTSNAENEPSARLTIMANIKAVIDVSETYLNLDAKNVKTSHTVYLASKKQDLKILGISFKANGNSEVPEWQSEIPLQIRYTFTSSDSTRTDSCRVFKLNLYAPDIDKANYGTITIRTNHPDKQEISIPCSISK